MKILLINKFHYRRGGSETYYFTLADALSALGHEVIFFAMEDSRNDPCGQAAYFVPGVDYNGGRGGARRLRDGARLLYNLPARRRLLALLDAEKPDVAHLNLVHRQLSFSVVDALHARGIPMAFTVHDLVCICPCGTMRSSAGLCDACLGGRFGACVRHECIKDSRAKSLLAATEAVFLRQRRSYDRIGLYIAPSRFYADALLRAQFTASPIVHRANPLPRERNTTLDTSDDGSLLFLGRLSSEKGVLTLLEAMRTTQLQLLVAGDGPQRAEIEATLDAYGLRSRVHLLGHQSPSETNRLIGRCRGVVVPSIWYENAPYAVMEAMARGKPVIASDIGGLSELVEDGVTGLLCAPQQPGALAAAIAQLAAMPEGTYAAMCHAAQASAQARFDWRAYGEWVTGAYRELLRARAA